MSSTFKDENRSSMTTQHWFIRLDGSEIGPLSSVELRQLAEQRVVNLKTPVSPDKVSWHDAATVRDLFPARNGSQHSMPPPPLPPLPVTPLPQEDGAPPAFILTDPPNLAGRVASRRRRRRSRQLPTATPLIAWLLAAFVTLVIICITVLVLLAMEVRPPIAVGAMCGAFLFPLLKRLFTHAFTD